MNPLAYGKIQGILLSLSVFQVLFKAIIIFKDFSRQNCTFKYFSSLFKAYNIQNTNNFIQTYVSVIGGLLENQTGRAIVVGKI